MVFNSIKPVAGHCCIGDRLASEKLKQNVKQQSEALLELTDKKRASMRDSLTTDKIAKKMTANGENVLTSLPFTKTSLFDVSGKAASKLHALVGSGDPSLRAELSEGLLVLTDKRLIFVSNLQGKLEKEADDKAHFYCGKLSCLLCLATCDCGLLCDPIDIWKKCAALAQRASLPTRACHDAPRSDLRAALIAGPRARSTTTTACSWTWTTRRRASCASAAPAAPAATPASRAWARPSTCCPPR